MGQQFLQRVTRSFTLIGLVSILSQYAQPATIAAAPITDLHPAVAQEALPPPIESEPVPHPEPPPDSLPGRAHIGPSIEKRFALGFVPNRGQLDRQVQFHARSKEGTLFFLPNELIFEVAIPSLATTDPRSAVSDPLTATAAVSLTAIHMQFDRANPSPIMTGTNQLPGTANFLIGNDPARWQTNLPTFGSLTYQSLYAGIDVTYDDQQGALKSTFAVAAGADPNQIRWRYPRASALTVDSAGNLLISVPVTQNGVVIPTVTPTPQPTSTVLPATQTAVPITTTVSVPITTTIIAPLGTTVASTPVAAGSVTTTTNQISTSALSVAPQLVSVTSVITLTEQAPVAWQIIKGQRLPVDVRYVTNADTSLSFGLGAYDSAYPLLIDPIFAYTFVQDYNGADDPRALAIDASRNTYITGLTTSTNLPTTTASADASYNGGNDAFVIKLDPTGTTPLYTTYLGGEFDDIGYGIAVDASGQTVIAGATFSSLFPRTIGPALVNTTFQDAFVTKLNAAGSGLVFSRLFGSDKADNARGVAVDFSGAIYVTGKTGAANFLLVNPSDSSFDSGGTMSGTPSDAFIAKITGDGNSILFSTFFGGNSSDAGTSITVDGAGTSLYITGSTSSNVNFPATIGAYAGGSDVFVAKLSATSQALVYGRYIGGNGFDQALAIALTTGGNAVAVGETDSTNFPLAAPAQGSNAGFMDGFVTKLSADGTSLVFSTYLGGSDNETSQAITIDANGVILVAGYTRSGSSFPSINPIPGTTITGNDATLTAYSPTGSYIYNTRVTPSVAHGVVVDTSNQVYVAGGGSGNTGGRMFVIKISDSIPVPYDELLVPESCPCGLANYNTSTPVNTRSGNFWTKMLDLRVETPGADLIWSRTYSSQTVNSLTASTISPGWRHPYSGYLLTPGMSGGESGKIVIISPEGNKQRFVDFGGGQYDPAPGVYSTLSLSGGVYTQLMRDASQYRFDATNGRLSSMLDSQGRQINLAYNGSNQLISITDIRDSTRNLTLTYTSGRISKVTAGTRFVDYGYTGGNLTSVSDVLAHISTYTYHSGTSLLWQIRNPLNELVEQVTYDAASPPRVQTQLLHDERQVQFQYLATSTKMTITGQDGRQDVEEITYAADNTMTGRIVNGQAVLSTDFDTSIAPETVRDGNNKQTSTVYSDNGLPLIVTNALYQKTFYQYDSKNNLTVLTDALGLTTRYRYDQYNNVISMTMGLTTTSLVRATTLYTYSYDIRYTGDSLLREMRSPDGIVTRYEYPTTGTVTARGQASQMILGYGTAQTRTTAFTYDSAGRLTQTTTGVGTTLQRVDQTIYRADNTIDKTIQNYKNGIFTPTAPDEDIITTYGYDNVGRQVWVRDALGRYNATHYNDDGQVDWTARNVSPLQVDGTGQVLLPTYSVTAPAANVAMKYAYDGLGRTTLMTETGILTGSFNLALRQFSTATERVTRTEYDTRNRPITITLNFQPSLSATADRNVKYYTRYDGASNVISQTDGIGRVVFTPVDALNRAIFVNENYDDGEPTIGASTGDRIHSSSYDAIGRVREQITNKAFGVFSVTAPITDTTTRYDYDSLSRVITTTVNYSSFTSTDPAINRESVSKYDLATTRLVGQRDPLGRWMSIGYDLLGQATQQWQNCTTSGGSPVASGCAAYTLANTDRNILTLTGYDTLGRTTDVYQNHENGIYDSIAPDRDIRRQTVYDGVGRVIRTVGSYDNGVYTSSIPDRDIITLRAYDALGRTLVMTDVLNAVTRYGYNGLDQTTVITDSIGRVTRMGYDGAGMQRWNATPDGRVSITQVDGLGQVVATIQSYQDGVSTSGEPDRDLITRTVYDAAGRRTRLVDALGRSTAFTYDNLNRLIAVTENYLTSGCTGGMVDCNIQTQYQYDRADNRTRVIDGRSIMTQRAEYDAANQQRKVFDGLNYLTEFTYDAFGRMTKRFDPRGSTNDVTYTYDGLNRQTGISATNLGTISMDYDSLGRRRSLVDATGTTSFSYDSLGRMRSLDAPNTGLVSYSYNGRGERTQIVYPSASPALDYLYFADGQLQTVKQGGTTLATYAYDEVGRLAQVARNNGAVTNYGYDSADRLRAVRTLSKQALAGKVLYDLDRFGRRTSASEAWPTTVTPSATRLKTITFEAGRLIDSSSGGDGVGGTVSLERTGPLKEFAAARVVNQTNSYVAEDLSATDELYVTLYLRIDALPTSVSRIVAIRNSGTTVGNLAVTSSGTLQLRNAGTVIGSSSALAIGTLYRIGIRQKKGTGANGILQAVLATGDATFGTPFAQSTNQSFTSQVTEVQVGATASPAISLTFDEIAVDTAGYAAPSTVTATKTTGYGYDNLNRLTGATESPGFSYGYSYDKAGNRTDAGWSYNAANQVTSWTYDAAGNLLSPGGPSYTYDALNRITDVSGTTASYNGDGTLVSQTTSGTTTRYVQDLAAPLSQILQTVVGGTRTSYLYGQERLAVAGSPRTWFLNDGLGSVRRTLNDSGSVLATTSYDPWGVAQSALSTPFGFTGELHNGLNMTYLRARWYAAEQAVFTSRDPFEGWQEQPQSLAPYTYVHNEPVNGTDPTGKWRFGSTKGRPDLLGFIEHLLIEERYIPYINDPRIAHVEYSFSLNDAILSCMIADAFPNKGRAPKRDEKPWQALTFPIDILNSRSGEVFDIKPDFPAAVRLGQIQSTIYSMALNVMGQRNRLSGVVPSGLTIQPWTWVAPTGTSYDWNSVPWTLGLQFPPRVLISKTTEAELWAGFKTLGVIVYWYEQDEAQKLRSPIRDQRKGLVKDPGYIPTKGRGEPGRGGTKPVPFPVPPLPSPLIPIPIL